MINLFKSTYCNFWQCPKMAWLNKYKPEVKTEDPTLEAHFISGNEVGDLAIVKVWQELVRVGGGERIG